MISHVLLKDRGILIVTPDGPLEENDFTILAEVVDPFIEAEGTLHGLIIYTETFPGWKNFSGLLHHLRFVKDHHRQIEKVAVVTDFAILSIGPRIADHFIHAEVKHFDYRDKEKALSWLYGKNPNNYFH